MKTGADLEQARHPAAQNSTRPSLGSVIRLEDLQQRAFARSIAADDAKHLALA